MSLFNTVSFIIQRPVPDTYVKGKLVEGAETPIPATGSWQPDNGFNLQGLAEGRRSSQQFRGFTNTPVFGTDQKTGETKDFIEINNERYEVVEVSPWANGIIPHYEFVAELVKEKSP